MAQTHPVTLAVPPDATDHSAGDAHAPVILIEYGDFECPSCLVAAPTPKLLLERFPGRLRFIFRHFPLEAAHPHALEAAEAAEAAAAQGCFWPMHDLLFANQARLEFEALVHYGVQLGLERRRYVADLESHVYMPRVRAQAEGGARSHIRATPTFFVDGVVQDVSFGMQGLHDAVAAAVARAG